jgi:hypothetical protein
LGKGGKVSVPYSKKKPQVEDALLAWGRAFDYIYAALEEKAGDLPDQFKEAARLTQATCAAQEATKLVGEVSIGD